MPDEEERDALYAGLAIYLLMKPPRPEGKSGGAFGQGQGEGYEQGEYDLVRQLIDYCMQNSKYLSEPQEYEG